MDFKKPKIYIPAILLVCIVIYALWPKQSEELALTAKARYDNFENLVVSSGELLAENSRNIMGPEGMQRYRIYDLKVDDIIPEGTYVKKGDYIATLDRSELTNRINDTDLDLEKAESQYTQIKLDTALTLRDARDNIRNLMFLEEQAKLTLEQSKYEPPATIKQAAINVDKAKRSVIQAQENYILKQKQAVAKLKEAQSNLQKSRNKRESLQEIQDKFTILAPDDGMLIYKRDWSGEKVKTGSQVSTWEPVVGTLPDLTSLHSKTFINEVDISKVRVDQNVKISLDAFPDAALKGVVLEVANMGEKRRNDDSKVFEVVIQVTESDSTYRPGMTTSNKIITDEADSVLLVPIEAIFGEDELSWVYLKKGGDIVRKEVKTGAANDVDIIIKEGLKDDDEVLLSEPTNGRNLKLVSL